MNKRTVGDEYENKAAEFLEKQGYKILERNYRNRYGEIDIIAKDKDYLVFVEVKYRNSIRDGLPAEAVDFHKQNKITKVAMYYCMQKRISEYEPMRFDVVGILGEEITLYKNAFEAAI